MAECDGMNGACSEDHSTCAQDMREGTHTGCETMEMTPDQCETIHGGTSGDMMSGACH